MQNKSKCTILISIFLMLTIVIPIVVPDGEAQATSTKVTYAFVGALPNPVGVGQEVLIHVGVTDPLNFLTEGWEGLTVTITKPDGTTETLGPFKTDSTGGTGTVYIPTSTGTYTLQTHFPQQVIPSATRFIPANTTMLASGSEKIELVVQTDPIQYYPQHPLPTEYWTRPIDAQHREWNIISGNWLESGSMINIFPHNWPRRYAPHNQAPESAHILWARPLTTGGLAGGNLGDHSMAVGDAYQGRFGGSVILNGILYYNRYWVGFGGAPPQQGIVAINLRTGEELWFRNNTRLMFGQAFYWDSYNMHGTLAYIWGSAPPVAGAFLPITNWDAYDAFTGEWVYSMKGVPMGTMTYGPKGEIFVYTINTTAGWMSLWNSSRVVSPHGSWEPDGRTYTNAAQLGLEWNVSIPTGIPGGVNAVFEDRIIGSTVPGWTGLANSPITFWGLSVKHENAGTLLFKETWQPPPGNLTMLFGSSSFADGIFTVTAKDTRNLYGFSIETGKQLWGPSITQPYLDIYTLGEERAISRAVVIAEGKVFSTGMGGVVHCLDAKTGQLIWKYEVDDKYSEILWSNNWPTRIAFVSDGKIYLCHDEHSPINPLPRGAPFISLDIETGNEVWKIEGAFRQTEWGGTAIIGDSIIALYNSFDQRIYALGKGPSATTITASDISSTRNTPIVIRGAVTDISPGTKDYAVSVRFPHGVPAVSDESMSEWMKYVYMQFSRPADIVGVEVILSVTDANGNTYDIGTATSDASGNFDLVWTPEIPGRYTVFATFEGSNSYWPSYAQTTVNVHEVATAQPEQPTTDRPQTELYIVGMGIAILAAIAIVGLLLLRKRP